MMIISSILLLYSIKNNPDLASSSKMEGDRKGLRLKRLEEPQQQQALQVFDRIFNAGRFDEDEIFVKDVWKEYTGWPLNDMENQYKFMVKHVNFESLIVFPQHNKKLKYLNVGSLLLDGGEEGVDGDLNMSMNLLTIAGTTNVVFLDELLEARLKPDMSDSNGRTALVTDMSKMDKNKAKRTKSSTGMERA
ncbi:potassium channel AKT2/3 [Tanacetum coccineum]